MHQTVFSVIFVSLLNGLLSYNWDPEELQCVQELNLDKAVIGSFQKSSLKPEDNAELNSFLECAWKRQGKLNGNGEIDWDKVDAGRRQDYARYMKIAKNSEEKEVLSKASGILKKAITECRGKNYRGETPGQTVAKTQNCLETSILRQVEHIRKNLLVLQRFF